MISVDSPAHSSALAAMTIGSGAGFTTTEATSSQPLASVTVTKMVSILVGVKVVLAVLSPVLQL